MRRETKSAREDSSGYPIHPPRTQHASLHHNRECLMKPTRAPFDAAHPRMAIPMFQRSAFFAGKKC